MCVTVCEELNDDDDDDDDVTQCLQNSNGGNTVPVKEGEENTIKIEVTSESGISKIYVIRVRRLSAKDAVLSGIKVNISKITPDFLPHNLEYFCK